MWLTTYAASLTANETRFDSHKRHSQSLSRVRPLVAASASQGHLAFADKGLWSSPRAVILFPLYLLKPLRFPLILISLVQFLCQISEAPWRR